MTRFLVPLSLLFIFFLSGVSYAETYTLNIDSDSALETITKTNSQITVSHPNGPTHAYDMYSNTIFYINSFADTDGVPGKEIIVLATQGASLGWIDVIHDTTGTYHRYPFNNKLFAITTVTDMDGIAGEEIVVNWTQGLSYAGIAVISDKTGQYPSWPMNSMSYAINGVGETNGQGGNDLVVMKIQGSIGNVPPEARDDLATTEPGVPVIIDVLANDVDIVGNIVPATLTITENPAHGTVQIQADYKVKYTPESGFIGTDTFKYIVADDDGAFSNEATVTVVVGSAQAGSGSAPAIIVIEEAGVIIEDTSGMEVAEAPQASGSTGTSAWIDIIHYYNGSVTGYPYPFHGMTFGINKIVDTDGISGDEVIVIWAQGTQQGIRVIHDKSHDYNPPYIIPGQFAIQGVQDYDYIAGAEICYEWTEAGYLTRYGMIIDRIDYQNNNTGSSGCQYTTPEIEVSPTSHDFGDVEVETSSSLITFTVRNRSDGILQIGPVQLTGGDDTEFTINVDNCSDNFINPSGSCDIRVSFAPGSTGQKYTSMYISSNVPDSISVALSGTGVDEPTPPNPLPQPISISPESKDFNSTPVWSMSDAQIFTVKNNTIAPISIGTIVVTDVDAFEFQIMDNFCSGNSVPALASCTVSALFTPGSGGLKNAYLTIPWFFTSDPSNVRIVDIPLSGEGNWAVLVPIINLILN